MINYSTTVSSQPHAVSRQPQKEVEMLVAHFSLWRLSNEFKLAGPLAMQMHSFSAQ